MMWTLPLRVCVLMMAVHLSSQDLVTLAPSEAEPEVTDLTTPATTPAVEAKLTPTIRALHITSDIKYRYATTLVSSRVVNPSDNSSEAAFILTLPESAFISEFLMEVKGKVYKAYVKEKEEAKAVYNQAVQEGHFAGHVALDARDSNRFTVSVNLEAHGKVTFNLTYEQLLSRNLGYYSNIININPQQIVNDMSVTVNIEEPTAITSLEVPELQISNEALPDKAKENTLANIVEKSPNHKQVIWAPTAEQQKSQNSTGLSGQFIVKYDVNREANPQQILVDEGYFVHFFAPENLPKLKKHVVFVLDYSGSMAGRKLDQLKDAMNKILSDLDSKDFFSIVIFQSIVEAWSPKQTYSTALEHLSKWELERLPTPSSKATLNHEFVVKASPENIDLARSYLANYSDLGATNIIGGIRTGLELVKIGSDQWINESDPPQAVVVFLTDGQPNVEEYDTDAIINKTKHLNTKECPIFSLAFGYGADFNFLRKLSLSNFGFARNIYEAADASDQLKNFYQTIASPLISNVTFSYLPGQVDNSSNTKKEFPVYFKGSEIVVAGKINKDSVKDNANIGELSGVTANGIRRFPIIIDIVLKPVNRSLGHLEKAWAYLTIQQLLDKADSLDNTLEKNQTKEKALQLALQYSFVTPLTSLVVVKPNETESAVDTTQVKPGNEQFPMYGASGLGSGFAAPSSGGVQLSMLSGAFPPPPRMPSSSYAMTASNYGGGYMPQYLSTPFAHRQPAVFPTTPTAAEQDSILDSSTQKGTIEDVKWLQQYTTNSSGSGNLTVTIQGKQYNLALNETDQAFGACHVNNASGECHHIAHCALTVFQNDLMDFIPYQCPIPGNFLGVCCLVENKSQAVSSHSDMS